MASTSSEPERELHQVYGGWGYLAALFVVFLAIAFIAYGCDDDSGSSLGTSAGSTTTLEPGAATGSTPVSLTVVVSDAEVTLRGAVPDEGARAQLVEAAEAVYGEGNVVDELTIDDDTVIAGGSVRMQGGTIVGDGRPDELLAAVIAIGLADAGNDVVYAELTLEPVDVEATVSNAGAVLVGPMPDNDSLEDLVERAESVWGADAVDASALTIDPAYTLDGGRIAVTGVVDVGDTRSAAFVGSLGEIGITVDNSVEIDESAAALGRLEERLRTQLRANPINFELGSATITPDSDAILEDVAVAIRAAPGIPVEIVGHTDASGDSAVNQKLSEDRAEAVLERLVELGVDEGRLSARGAGETEPVASNDTEEGRAQNRRIEFEFAGADTAATGETEGAPETDEEEG